MCADNAPELGGVIEYDVTLEKLVQHKKRDVGPSLIGEGADLINHVHRRGIIVDRARQGSKPARAKLPLRLHSRGPGPARNRLYSR